MPVPPVRSALVVCAIFPARPTLLSVALNAWIPSVATATAGLVTMPANPVNFVTMVSVKPDVREARPSVMVDAKTQRLPVCIVENVAMSAKPDASVLPDNVH